MSDEQRITEDVSALLHEAAKKSGSVAARRRQPDRPPSVR